MNQMKGEYQIDKRLTFTGLATVEEGCPCEDMAMTWGGGMNSEVAGEVITGGGW